MSSQRIEKFEDLIERLAEGLKDIKEGRVVGPFKTSRAAIRALRPRNE